MWKPCSFQYKASKAYKHGECITRGHPKPMPVCSPSQPRIPEHIVDNGRPILGHFVVGVHAILGAALAGV